MRILQFYDLCELIVEMKDMGRRNGEGVRLRWK